jgi:hypothetical protein
MQRASDLESLRNMARVALPKDQLCADPQGRSEVGADVTFGLLNHSPSALEVWNGQIPLPAVEFLACHHAQFQDITSLQQNLGGVKTVIKIGLHHVCR